MRARPDVPVHLLWDDVDPMLTEKKKKKKKKKSGWGLKLEGDGCTGVTNITLSNLPGLKLEEASEGSHCDAEAATAAAPAQMPDTSQADDVEMEAEEPLRSHRRSAARRVVAD